MELAENKNLLSFNKRINHVFEYFLSVMPPVAMRGKSVIVARKKSNKHLDGTFQQQLNKNENGYLVIISHGYHRSMKSRE